MLTFRLIAPLLAALAIVPGPVQADQILGQSRIDTSNRMVLPSGPTLGIWQGNRYTATPDAIQIKRDGSSARSMRFGGNRGDVFYGLQVGGAVQEDGSEGVINRLEGHATWQGLFPSRDLSTIEVAVHPTVATGQATAASGTNRLTWIQGRPLDTAWVGRKIYFNGTVLRVASVSGTTATVTVIDGSAYTFPANITDMFTVGYVYGRGTANVSGKTVSRISGDPFLPFVTGPEGAAFEFRINGITRAVSAFTDTKTISLTASVGNLTNVNYEFFWDANDQISTLRLHGTEVDAENFSISKRFDGTWLENQYSSYGKYRPIRLSTGELAYAPGSKIQQVVARANGDISLGGDYGWDILRIPGQTVQRANYFVMQPGPADFGPSLLARGSDVNVGLNVELQGEGIFTVSNTNFGQTIFQVFGTASTGQNWLAAYAYSTPAIQAHGAGANISAALLGKGNSGVLTGAFVRAADPTTGDIPTGQCADWNNTATGTFRHVCNFSGTLRWVAMQ